MTSQLLKRYEKTGQKAAMIFTSSDYANIPIPGIVTYSACKSFTSFLGEGLHSELKDKVDIISLKPGNVDTKMNPQGQEFLPVNDFI